MADEPTGSAAEAPAAAPAPAEQAAPVQPTEVNDFAGLDQDLDEDLPTEPQAAAAEEAAPTEAQPATEEPPKAPAQEEQPQEPQAPAPAEEGPKEPGAEAPSSAPSEPQNILAQIEENRGEILNELAASRFALSEEEKKQLTEGLDTDSTATLLEYAPKLASRVYYEAVSATLNHINQLVPAMIVNTMKLVEDSKAAEAAFLGQFPAIDREKHWGDVTTFANVFRQQNPNIKQEDLFASIGAAVMAKYGLKPPAPNGANGGAKPTPPPFTPAQAGVSVTRTAEPETPYAGLGGDYDE